MRSRIEVGDGADDAHAYVFGYMAGDGARAVGETGAPGERVGDCGGAVDGGALWVGEEGHRAGRG